MGPASKKVIRRIVNIRPDLLMKTRIYFGGRMCDARISTSQKILFLRAHFLPGG